jgi:hypothetical protein
VLNVTSMTALAPRAVACQTIRSNRLLARFRHQLRVFLDLTSHHVLEAREKSRPTWRARMVLP